MHSVAANRRSTSVTSHRTSARTRWYALQALVFGAGLVLLAVVMYLAASPDGALARTVPPLASPEPYPQVSAFVGMPSVPRHIVLLVSDPDLGLLLQERIETGRIIQGEHGANASTLRFELIVISGDEDLSTLVRGLREFDAHCAAEPCPAVEVIDLRKTQTTP